MAKKTKKAAVMIETNDETIIAGTEVPANIGDDVVVDEVVLDSTETSDQGTEDSQEEPTNGGAELDVEQTPEITPEESVAPETPAVEQTLPEADSPVTEEPVAPTITDVVVTEEEPAPVIEEIIQAQEVRNTQEIICSWNNTVNMQLISALNQLNGLSSRQMDEIVRARYTVYNNIFAAIGHATDAQANEFIEALLAAINSRKFVTNKDRAMLGFMRLSNLNNVQSNMYQTVWRTLIDMSNPATRRSNGKNIRWGVLSSALANHKLGDEVYRKLNRFFQQ